MIFNPFLAQRLAEAYIQAALREAEEDRLVQAIMKGHSSPKRSPSVILALGMLLGLVGQGSRACR
ncbi:MAG TPA: hypothetical protein G4O00_09030 [Thermoflexia bacterium]|jgi:hypothetical protein|nr:hypothetical protein [Thermoflexia bacterium]